MKKLLYCKFSINKTQSGSTQGIISESFRNLEIRRVFKHSFHSLSIDVRSNNGELFPFFSLGYTHLSLQECAKTVSSTTFQFILSVIQLLNGWLYKNVDYFRNIPRQRKGLGSFSQYDWKTAFPIFRKYFLPAAKKLGQEALEAAFLKLRGEFSPADSR